MKKTKILSMILSVAVLGTMLTPVIAASYPDTGGHWAAAAINSWSDSGVLQGDERGFRPDDLITRAETATVINNVIGYTTAADNGFYDLDRSAWYADAILKLNKAGVMNGDGDGTVRPEAYISREETMVMFARAFGLKVTNASVSQYPDASAISPWAIDQIGQMSAVGYIHGDENGKMRPSDAITRAEVVTIVDNMVGLYAQYGGSYQGNYGMKIAVIKSGGTTVSMSYLGGAVISPLVGNGSVTFNNSTQINGNLTNLAPDADISTSGAWVSSTSGIGSSGGSSIIPPFGPGTNHNNNNNNSSSATYTVRFSPNGGAWSSSSSNSGTKKVTYRKNATLDSKSPDDPVRDGYYFTGWYERQYQPDKTNENYYVRGSSRVTSAMTLYAGWKSKASPSPSPEVEKVTVTFVTNADAVPETQTFAKGGTVPKQISNPKRTGYSFVGWYYGTAKTDSPFSWKDKISENKTVYAVWEPDEANKEKVVQIAASQAQVENVQDVVIYPPTALGGEKVQVLVTAKKGYQSKTPVISYLAPNSETPVTVTGITESESGLYTFTVDSQLEGAVFTVTPVVELANHQITIEKTGEGTVTLSKSEGILYDEKITVQAEPAVGYKLETLKVVADEEEVFSLTLGESQLSEEGYSFNMPDKNAVVKANFVRTNEPIYEIKVEIPNTGGSIETLPTGSVLEGTKVVVKPTPDTGHQLKSVSYRTEDGAAIALTAQEGEYSFLMPNKGVTVSAEFERIAYSVTFDSQGGSAVDAQQVLYGDLVSKPADPQRDGYHFGGWYTAADPKDGFEYQFAPKLDTDAEKTEAIRYQVTSNMTLYANWIGDPVVTFETNGGSAISGQIVNYGAVLAKPSDPVKEGHTFEGWYTDAQCSNAYDFSKQVTAPLSLYAKWKAENYTVSFDTKAPGVTVPAQNVQYGGKAVEPKAPERTGYQFDGWYTDAAYKAGSEYDFNTPVKGPATLYAKWTEISKLKVTFNANGGVWGTERQKVIEVTKDAAIGAAAPANPTREGYTFAGWYNTEAGANAKSAIDQFQLTEKVTVGRTLYAGWTAVEETGK